MPNEDKKELNINNIFDEEKQNREKIEVQERMGGGLFYELSYEGKEILRKEKAQELIKNKLKNLINIPNDQSLSQQSLIQKLLECIPEGHPNLNKEREKIFKDLESIHRNGVNKKELKIQIHVGLN